nr:hypothetical protein Iba_chr09aCG3170 [Ipomoea batatas]
MVQARSSLGDFEVSHLQEETHVSIVKQTGEWQRDVPFRDPCWDGELFVVLWLPLKLDPSLEIVSGKEQY